MKHNIIHINLIQSKGGNGNETGNNTEELNRLYDILYPKKVKKDKRKKNKPYLLREDIEDLHKKYAALFKDVETNAYLPHSQADKECETLSLKYDFEIEELSKKRKKEYLEAQAKIKADDDLQIPWRRSWLWRLIFQPVTNRAQDIIERRAELEAEEKFAPMEKELDELADKVYAGKCKKLSRRKRQRLMKKYLKYRDKLIADTEQSETAAAQTPQENCSTAAPAASDAAHRNGNTGETNAGNVAESPAPALPAAFSEPPEPPARKPRNNKSTGG